MTKQSPFILRPRLIWQGLMLLAIGLHLFLSSSCAGIPEDDTHDHDHIHQPVPLGKLTQSMISCGRRSDTGYVRGSAFSITVVTVDGKPVEVDTANAYWVMKQAAARAGVSLRVISGFRTMSEQQYLYNCYLTKRCNNGNLAARPGYSNHQSGHALDLNASSPGVYNWLANNAGRFGFKRTVPSENWHWEWWGGGPGGGPCQGSTPTGCTPACLDAGTLRASNCQKIKCSLVGAKCTTVGGPRCHSVFCPPTGTKKFCLKGELATCNNGNISIARCSAFGLTCTEVGGARCRSVFCPATGTKKFCLKGELATCKDGNISVAKCSAFGLKCTEVGGARCHSVFCPPTGEKKFCLKGELAICKDGNISIAKCSAFGLTCTEEGGARCHSVFCPPTGEKKFCLQNNLGVCKDGRLELVKCPTVGANCTEEGGARCHSVFCPPTGEKTLCVGNDLGLCKNGDLKLLRCPEGNACTESPSPRCGGPDGAQVSWEDAPDIPFDESPPNASSKPKAGDQGNDNEGVVSPSPPSTNQATNQKDDVVQLNPQPKPPSSQAPRAGLGCQVTGGPSPATPGGLSAFLLLFLCLLRRKERD